MELDASVGSRPPLANYLDAWAAALFAAPAIPETWPPLWAMEWMASGLYHLWLFCVGACVGSFLNVVVYRLPRRMNLAHPGSCCPQCGRAIRLWDNIPILSWLVLRGRCRDCRGPISPRYFWIELLVATMFLAVAFWERSSWIGVPLGFPVRPLPSPEYDVWPYWCRYAIHVVQLTTLLGGVLILGDGFRTPAKLFWPAILLALALPVAWPEIRSVPAWRFGPLPDWQASLIDGLVGLAVGVFAGAAGSLWRWISRGEWPPFAPVSWTASMCVVLGWQRGLLWSVPGFAAYLALAGVLWSWQSYWKTRHPVDVVEVRQEPHPPVLTDPPTTDPPTTDPPTTDRPTTDPPADPPPEPPLS